MKNYISRLCTHPLGDPPPPGPRRGRRAETPSGPCPVQGDQGAAGSPRSSAPKSAPRAGKCSAHPGASLPSGQQQERLQQQHLELPSGPSGCSARQQSKVRPVCPSGAQLVAEGAAGHPTQQLHQRPRVGHPCPAVGARSTGHTQPPTRNARASTHTHGKLSLVERVGQAPSRTRFGPEY